MLTMRFWLFLVLLGFPLSAYAQNQSVLVPNTLSRANPDTGVTITSTSAAVVPAGTYGFVELANQDQAAFVYCKWGGTPVAAATLGQRTFPPLSGYIWDALDPAPANLALNCISAVSSSPATVRAY